MGSGVVKDADCPVVRGLAMTLSPSAAMQSWTVEVQLEVPSAFCMSVRWEGLEAGALWQAQAVASVPVLGDVFGSSACHGEGLCFQAGFSARQGHDAFCFKRGQHTLLYFNFNNKVPYICMQEGVRTTTACPMLK